MYKPVVLFIGLRYICERTSGRFSCFISWLSTIAIALSVMIMVMVLSVMNGFERELKNKILGLIPQAILLSVNGSLNSQQLPEEIAQLDGVIHVTPLTISDVVLQSTNNIAVGLMLGIDPIREDPLTPYLVNVKKTDLTPGKYNIILGEQLARQLNVGCGDQLRVMVPFVNQLIPVDYLPIQRLFNVIGTFFTKSEVDNYQILVNIQDASYLMHYPIDNITGWRLWLKEPLKVENFSKQRLPEGTKWQDWRERKGELFQAVRMEKNAMGLLLSLIVSIAIFNTITLISLKVRRKQNEIAILQTQGLTPYQIMTVFIIQGVGLGIIGVFFGTILGLVLISQLNNLMLVINSFLEITLPALPVAVELLQVINIALYTITVVLLSTIYPSWYATKIQPVEALRYE